VLPAVRAQLGFGKLRIAFVGDRSIPAEIDHWARALGVTVRFINPFRKGETYV
jgi:long-subunit acyl-CoA synthetase (AMP-forming)